MEVTNTFKGLDLVGKVPEELWMEVHTTVQEVAFKTIPKKKKCKKAKWLSEEDFQITREASELQRVPRRDKRASSVINAEKQENNRLGKTRDLFRKTEDTKGTFYAKMGSIKDRNGKGLTEAEEIKKRWQEYTEELYKKGLNDPDNQMVCSLT